MEYWRDLSSWLKETYGRRLYRVPLDAGMTCPVRDGTISRTGCTFCAGGSGSFAIRYEGQKLSMEDLIYNGQNVPAGDYIGYFQAYTNTYAPVERLRFLFEHALADPLFAGIDIATRPDCIDAECLQLLQQLKEAYPHKFIWVELGLQTAVDATAETIGRGYSYDVFETCVQRLAEAGICVIVHVILSLPEEGLQDNIATMHALNALPVQGVKIQMLQILKGSVMAEEYRRDPDAFALFSEKEYAERCAYCLGHLRRDIVVHRLTGDGDRSLLLAPLWGVAKTQVINNIRHIMKEKHITQGSLL